MGRRSRRRRDDRDQRYDDMLAGARAAVERDREGVAQAEALREHMGPEEVKALEAAKADLRENERQLGENERQLAEHRGEPPPAG